MIYIRAHHSFSKIHVILVMFIKKNLSLLLAATSIFISDDVFSGVRAGQPVTHMTSQAIANNKHPTIQCIPDGQSQILPYIFFLFVKPLHSKSFHANDLKKPTLKKCLIPRLI